MRRAVLSESAPLVRTVLCLTLANRLSIGFKVGGGFRSSFFKVIRKLEASGKIGPDLTLHGLRHTVASRMRQFGFDARTIADMLGQETEGMALHYSREADLEPKLRGVVHEMTRENRLKNKFVENRRTKLFKAANRNGRKVR